MKFLQIGIGVFSLLLAACASHDSKPPKVRELFTTIIKRDDTKQFSYALTMAVPDDNKHDTSAGGHGGRGGGRHGNHNGGGRDHSKADKKEMDDDVDNPLAALFEENLEIKLNSTGFCRQGFKQLDKKSHPGIIQINGECNDKANDNDKTKFPNPPPVKVKEEVIE